MKLRYLVQIALSALIASAIAIPAIAIGGTRSETAAAQVAQAVGECRQVLRLERFYNAADVASDRIVDIAAGSNVTLAGPVNQPSTGWIRVSFPAQGYILAAFLAPCGSVPTPTPSPTPTPTPTPTPSPSPPQSNACGIVTASSLAIRSGPSTLSGATGSIASGNGFRIIGGPQTQTTPASDRGRVWVRINRNGAQGWIPETGPTGFNSGTNIRRVTCSSIGLP
ncbi:MAG: SH3 domain-containing protein [Microcoleus sp. SIO2G3]|nr:SH3 domain-containing protein [Microcoleus sp. SIO2G3]